MIPTMLLSISLGTPADRLPTFIMTGQWPTAVAVIRGRFERDPWSRGHQHDLAAIRLLVNLPAPFASAPPSGLRTHVSPFDLLVASIVLATVSVVIFVFRPRRYRKFSIALAIGWLMMMAVSFAIAESPPEFAVVDVDTVLRTGNAIEFAPAYPTPIPRCAEAIVHARRGGWARVTVGSVSGWLPESVLLN